MNRMLIIVWCAAATFLGCATVLADPQLSAGASLSPQNPVPGEIVTFQFSVTNSNAAESSNLSNSLLQVSCPIVAINGVPRYFDLISLTAPGGNVNFVYGEDGISGVNVVYGLLSKGTNRTFSASFQVPNSGLLNGSAFNVAAILTWAQAPGILTRSTSATLQASPSLQASLDPVPLFTAPGGSITYHARYNNVGSGITRKAWLVAPTPTNASPANIMIVTTNSAVWFSMLPHAIEQANSDDFIRNHFTPAFLDPQGTSVIPSGAMMIAVSLDDPELNLLPSGLPQEFIWQIQDPNNAVGTVINQGCWILSEDWPATQAVPRQTIIRLLPTDFSLHKMENLAILMFVGDPATTYQIERSEALVKWSILGSAFQTNQGFFQFMDSNPLPSKAFYRIATPAP